MYKITVIVPIYNAEKYFRECLESVINQTIGFENIQLILVDDCSTDNSKAIAEEYEKKYENISLFSTEKNTGVAGHARNVGLKYAEGEYVMFTDADDFYDLSACENMYNFIKEKKADFVTANYKYADENSTPWNNPIFDYDKYPTFNLNTGDFIKSFFILNSSVCNKIFRNDFIKKYSLKFLEGVPAEDAYFTYSSLMKTNNIYYNQKVIYYYRVRNTASTLSVSWNCSKSYFDKINSAYKSLYELFKDNNRLDYYRFFYAKNLTYMLYKFIDSKCMNYEEKIEVISNMRWFYKLSPELKVPACQKSLEVLINKIIEGEYKDFVDVCNVIADIRSYLPKDVREKMSKPSTEFYEALSISK